MAQCVPGMPCYPSGDAVVYYTYPRGCSTSVPSPFTVPLSSDNVIYTGPNLPYTGIQTDMEITESLQRIDAKLSSASIFALLISAIDNNPALLAILCNRVGTCP